MSSKPKLIDQTGEVLFSELDKYDAEGVTFATCDSAEFHKDPIGAADDCAAQNNLCNARGYCACDIRVCVGLPTHVLKNPDGVDELWAMLRRVWIRRDDLEDDNATTR